MTPEQIIEIAHRYSDKAYPAPDDSSRVTYWEFLEKDLIAFAQAVIETERERIKEIVAEVAWQGNHDKWFDCADAIADRIEE